MALSTLSTSTIGTIDAPGAHDKAFQAVPGVNQNAFGRGQVIGRQLHDKGVASPLSKLFFSTKPVNTAAMMPIR